MRVIIALAVAAVLAYAGSCFVFPFARCRCCKGTGRHTRGDGKKFRLCRWCVGGSGRRLRIGRRVFNAYRRRRALTR